MQFFIKNKPKKTILNILYLLGIISILINILAISIFSLWRYYPNFISKIDRLTPVYYVYKIKGLQWICNNSPSDKLTYFFKRQLYEELKDISILHKFYAVRQEITNYLIDYNIKNKNIEQALKIAKDWEKRYPYDFLGKFKYIDVLYLVDVNQSFNYYKKLYKEHSDIKEVADGYKLYLERINVNSVP